MSRFIGRDRELTTLNRFLVKKTASLIVIKGRRRIGKSRLIEEFGKNATIYNFMGLAPTEKTTAQDQRDEFCLQLSRQFNTPLLKGEDWSVIFHALAERAHQGHIIIALDEISWMGSKDPNFLGKLKSAWDLFFKKNDQLILILCGSVSSWIDKNILSSTAFFGRISLTLTLEELALSDCRKFWEQTGARVSPYEILKVLSVTGGIPRYLEEIDPNQTAENNIRDLCFKQEGLLANEFDKIFTDLFAKRSSVYKDIIRTLLDAPADIQTICDKLKMPKNGVISAYLDDLVLSGFIKRDYTWNLKTGKPSLLSHFRLKDNYLRFYLKVIEPNKALIDQNVFSDKSTASLPGWNTLMGLQFENLVLQNAPLIWEALRILPEDIIFANPYFQKKTNQHAGCQIDYMIQTRFNNLFVCEIKFSKNEVPASAITDAQEKIARLKLPRGFSTWPVLIHVNGVSEQVEESGYFSKVIDFSETLSR